MAPELPSRLGPPPGLGARLSSLAAERLLRLPPARTRNVRVRRDLVVPMRDGVRLLADLYQPAKQAKNRPTLLVRNLYGWDLPIGFLYGRLYAERGYQVLVQRCRGTFGSGGTLDPWVREAEDGADTAAWMAEQDWYGGGFATVGASYLGYTQWALLGSVPEGLRGAVVQMGPHEYARVAWPGGAFALDTMAGWASMLTHPKTGPLRDNLRQLVEQRALRRVAHRALPLGDAFRRALGRGWQPFDDWLAHPDPADPYWAASDMTKNIRAAAAEVPVLLQGNWYDPFLAHTLEQYAVLREGGGDPQLTVGPWTHAALAQWWSTFMTDSLRWLDELFAERAEGNGTAGGGRAAEAPGSARAAGVRTATVAGSAPAAETALGGTPAEGTPAGSVSAIGAARAVGARRSPVRVFVLGGDGADIAEGDAVAGAWRDLPAWPPAAAEQRRWYLQPDGGLDVAPPGVAAHADGPSRYRYDPADPTPALGGAWTGATAGPRDNRPLERRADVLVFTSAPLDADTETIGPVSAELYVRSSLAHTDFFVRLCDVRPDGRSVDVTDALLRVRPGTGTDEEDGVLRIRIELAPTACRFKAGHRLRVQVSSGAHPRFARSLGTDQPLGTAKRGFVADQEIFHDRARPSSITLNTPSPPRR